MSSLLVITMTTMLKIMKTAFNPPRDRRKIVLH